MYVPYICGVTSRFAIDYRIPLGQKKDVYTVTPCIGY